MAAQRPGLQYANLAIRGKLLGQVVTEQVPRAVELAPDLVSLAAGGNDILCGTDVDDLAALFEPAVAKLQAAGSRVLIFTGFDPRMFPVIRLLRGRIVAYNMHLRGIADDAGVALHCDGARIWNAAVALGTDPRALAAQEARVLDAVDALPEPAARDAVFASASPVPALMQAVQRGFDLGLDQGSHPDQRFAKARELSFESQSRQASPTRTGR